MSDSQILEEPTLVENTIYNEKAHEHKIAVKVVKRDGTLIDYNPSKIRVAIAKAFIDV